MCDVSCTSAVLSVETIRTARREEGCGPLGGAANVASLLGDELYHFDMSMNLYIRQQQSCKRFTLPIRLQRVTLSLLTAKSQTLV